MEVCNMKMKILLAASALPLNMAVVLAAMMLFSCTKKEDAESANQIENKKQSVWTDEELQPKEGEVTEDGQPVVMVFGATVNYVQKKQQSDEEAASETEEEDEVDRGALEEQQALAESGYDGEGVKSHLGDLVVDGDDKYYPNLWSVGDRVSINGVSSASLPEANITSGGKQARFPMAQWVEKYNGNWYVGYPASAFTFSAGVGTVTLPVKQTYVPGSYDPAAFIMVGKSDEQGLDFYPQVAPLRITVPGTSGTYFSKIRIEAVDGESLSGTFSTDYNNDEATFTALSGNNYVEMDTPNLEFGSTPVFFVLPAQKYTRGLRIRVTRSSDNKEMVFSNTKLIEVSVGNMLALTSPTFTPTTAQTTPELVEVTPSSFYVQWASGVPANDYAKRWRIEVWTNAACTGDPERTIEIYPKPKIAPGDPEPQHCWTDNQTPLRFVVGRMTPGTKYYVKVKDVGNNNSNSTPAEITLSSSPASVTMSDSNITTTGVVLRENFSEIGWSAAHYNGKTACGFYPATSSSSIGQREFTYLTTDDKTLFYALDDLYGFSYDRMNTAHERSRLAKWLYSGYAYWMPGYIKLGTKNNKGYLFTPAIHLAEGKTAVASVTVKVSKFDTNTADTWALAVVSGVVPNGDKDHYKRLAGSFTLPDASDASLYRTFTFRSEDGLLWTERTFDNLYLSDGDRLVLCLPDDAAYGSSKARINLGALTLTVTELTDDFIIHDATTLDDFRGAIADAVSASESTDITARVAADFSASTIASSWAPIAGYTGTLNGLTHTISGLTKPMFADLQGTVQNLTLNSTINYTEDTNDLGIFAQTLNGTISGCISEGSVIFCPGTAISGTHSVAGMVGQVSGGTVTNCTNNASVTIPHNSNTNDTELNVGGVIGYITAAASTYLENTGDISVSIKQANNTDARQCRVGGVVGCTDARNRNIIGCVNSGDITYAGTSYGSLKIGGIGGWVRRGMQTCSNSGSITTTNKGSVTRGTLHLGGLIGMHESYNSLSGSANTGTVSNAAPNSASDIEVGGLCGRCSRNISSSSNSGPVTNSALSNSMSVVGGLVGYAKVDGGLESTSYASCSNSGTISETSTSGEVRVGGICGYADGATDFSFCQNESTGTVTVGGASHTTVYASGILALSDGESSNVTLSSAINNGPITISTTAISGKLTIGGILAQANGPFPTISGTSLANTTNTGNISFSGVSISNELRLGGIWGWKNNANDGTVAYCRNEGSITANSGDLVTTFGSLNFVGGIVGSGYRGDGESQNAAINLTVQNCINLGNIYFNFKGRLYIGGIIGSVQNNPSYCTNQANISLKRGEYTSNNASNIGGIVGYHVRGSRKFVELHHIGTIHTNETKYCYASGLIGYTNGDSTFTSCSVEGSVSCQDYAPGLFLSFPSASSHTLTCKSGCTIKKGTKLIQTGTTTIDSVSDITSTNLTGGGGTITSSFPIANLSVVD